MIQAASNPSRRLDLKERRLLDQYKAEAAALLKSAKYDKALTYYSKAFELNDKDFDVLIGRSKASLKLRKLSMALDDADNAMQMDPNNTEALLQKAEVLFARGEFEMALVLFQRGHQLKPELEKFRLGVQKSTAAIQNAMTNLYK